MEQVYGSSSEDVLDPPIPGGRGITTHDRATTDLSATIKGWGSDLERANRPGVPRDKAPEIGSEQLYARMAQQRLPDFPIFKSTEHGRLTPVFGTSCPPSGLSGMLRAFAYKFSEGRHTHWLTLIVADRINVIEDFFKDIFHGRLPNIPKEMGIGAELRYNRAAFIRKSAITVGLIAAVIAVIWRIRAR